LTLRAPAADHPQAPRSGRALALLALAGVALTLAFAALGIWQVERRAWKLALMQRVEQRLHAEPVPLPPRAGWPREDAASHEYLPVLARSRWLRGMTVLTQAATELGAGFWVLTALQLDAGGQVLVNRGFIPEAQRGAWAAGTAARARGLEEAAPFFIDAGIPDPRAGNASPGAGPWPRPGMTVVRFHNSHLVYAITWFGLAAMAAAATVFVTRHELRPRAAAPTR